VCSIILKKRIKRHIRCKYKIRLISPVTDALPSDVSVCKLKTYLCMIFILHLINAVSTKVSITHMSKHRRKDIPSDTMMPEWFLYNVKTTKRKSVVIISSNTNSQNLILMFSTKPAIRINRIMTFCIIKTGIPSDIPCPFNGNMYLIRSYRSDMI